MHDFKKQMQEIFGVSEEDIAYMKKIQPTVEALREQVMHMHGSLSMPIVETVDGFHVVTYFDPSLETMVDKLGLMVLQDYIVYEAHKRVELEHASKIFVPGNTTLH